MSIKAITTTKCTTLVMMLDLFHTSLNIQLNSLNQNQFGNTRHTHTHTRLPTRTQILHRRNEDEQKYEAPQSFKQNNEVALALAD